MTHIDTDLPILVGEDARYFLGMKPHLNLPKAAKGWLRALLATYTDEAVSRALRFGRDVELTADQVEDYLSTQARYFHGEYYRPPPVARAPAVKPTPGGRDVAPFPAISWIASA